MVRAIVVRVRYMNEHTDSLTEVIRGTVVAIVVIAIRLGALPAFDGESHDGGEGGSGGSGIPGVYSVPASPSTHKACVAYFL